MCVNTLEIEWEWKSSLVKYKSNGYEPIIQVLLLLFLDDFALYAPNRLKTNIIIIFKKLRHG